MISSPKEALETLFSDAGIRINGRKPYDLQCHDDRLYSRILIDRGLGLGEAYMDGWWDAERPDMLIRRLLCAHPQEKIPAHPGTIPAVLASLMINRQGTDQAKRNAAHHYNIGNDLFERMLDKRMIYSCGYWKDATTLDGAQTAKLDLICRKLYLKPGMTLLDIGCGWGGFAEYAAFHYGAVVTGISPAQEQVKAAKNRVAGLPVTVLDKDYREVTGTFDRIVSIGMLEHVGPKNYDAFFAQCQNLLKPDGMMLHHTIGSNESLNGTDPWIEKYIFPGGVIPSLAQISKAIEKRFLIEDLQNLGPYYDKTLMAWHDNFIRRYPEIRDRYDERFYRMWRYYLLSSAGAFRARELQLWQIVMRPIEPSDVYHAIR